MNRTERIARLLTIPLLVVVIVLVVNDIRNPSESAKVRAETEGGTGTTTPFFGTETTTTTTPSGPTTTAAPGSAETGAAGSEATGTEAAGTEASGTEATALQLPEADQAAPPQEPAGTYTDGKVVLRGSVPTAELAAGYQARAASVLGEENVTMEMTLDPRVEGSSMTIVVEEQFRFPEGRTTFDPQFEALLNLGAAALQLLPEATLVVTGHTDDLGSDATNLALSQARAQVVVDWMVGKGVASERVVARGAGESEPIADNSTPEGRAANRRIEAVLQGVTPS